jgi:thioredoxin 1
MIEEQILASDKLIVDFWAPWCGPCKAMEPAFDELEKEFEVLKINVDDHPELARKYEVRGIPTTVLFEEGQETARVVGAQPLASLKEGLGL